MRKNNVALETEEKVKINESEIKGKKKHNKFKMFSIAALALIATLGITSYNKVENIVNSVSEENLNNAKEILSLYNADKYKVYVDQYDYTEEKYKADLNKISQYEDKIYAKYQNYLKYNNYKDDRSQNEIIEQLKNERYAHYFKGFELFYMGNDLSSGGKDLLYDTFSINIYHNNEKDAMFKYKNEMIDTGEKKSVIQQVGLKKFLLKHGAIMNINSYTKDNKVKPNVYLIEKSYAGRYDFSNPNVNESNNVVADYYLEIKRLNDLKLNGDLNESEFIEKSDKIYEEYMSKMLNDPEVMKETLKILNATNNIVESFYALKNNNINLNKGFIDEDFFVSIGFAIQKLISPNDFTNGLSEMPQIRKNNNFNNEKYSGYFINDTDIKMELSGYTDYLIKKEFN